MIAFFNGRYMEKDEIRISPDDRGFLFADGVYEVIRAYGGRLFHPEDHAARLARSMKKIRIDPPGGISFVAVARELLARNDLLEGDALVYIQVTRGAAPRRHAFPPGNAAPTVYAAASPFEAPEETKRRGVRVILVPDTRWARCDIKSVALLPNVLARQKAAEEGAEEALFVKEGFVTEGTHTSVCAVFEGRLRTHPANHGILTGITRRIVIDLCRKQGIPVEERPLPAGDIEKAEELMILSTTAEITPVVRVDGRPVGKGRPGPVTRRLQEAFRELTGR